MSVFEKNKIHLIAKPTLEMDDEERLLPIANVAEASDKCHKENRKTVNGDGICWAFSTLGFDNYAEAIVRYLYKYREAERLKANQNKGNSTPDNHEEESNYRSGGQHGRQTELPIPLEFRAMERGDNSQARPS
ncbi:nuclear transcription factor Y subunit B-4 [Quercus suber]|uniref:nuclear transcription factor Y subunit B-4 n=1 Tax=Quercus suber TaxID=58331 RepID=UPI0032DEAC5A